MSSPGGVLPLIPIQISNEEGFDPLNSGTSSQSITIHWLPELLTTAKYRAPPLSGLRSVHHGASTLFGGVGSGKFWLTVVLSPGSIVPPMMAYPLLRSEER